jgi:hypothetical protein
MPYPRRYALLHQAAGVLADRFDTRRLGPSG